MSEDLPSTPPHGEPEYLGNDSPVPFEDGPAASGGPRWGLVAGAGVAVVAAVAGGGFALAQLMSASGSPADAVPANALAYVSIDLDPSAAQKISALTTLRKFPALKKELDLDARDDVRRWLFEDVLSESGCERLSYPDDIEPWLGNRMAVAAVPDTGQTVSPLFAVQVSDQEAAAGGIAALSDCSGEDIGVAFTGDYAVLMEEQAAAESYAGAAASSSLADDPDFVAWMERAGDPGIVNGYVSAQAPARMTDLASTMAGDAEADLLGQDLSSLYRDFEGAAGVLRFIDGRIELEGVAAGLPGGIGATDSPGAPSLSDLPAGTAAAFTISFSEGWFEDWMETAGDFLAGAATGGGSEDLWKDVEASTGLQLPEDVEALLGDGLRVSVDSSLSSEAFTSGDVPQAPVGLRINGDEGEITRVLDRLLAQVPREQLGRHADLDGLLGYRVMLSGREGDAVALERRTGDGYVVIGLDKAYVDALTTAGDLGEQESFTAVVPEPDRVAGGLFVNFDAEDWATRIAGEMFPDEPEVVANVAPLDALGLTSWVQDDVTHVVFRLSTD